MLPKEIKTLQIGFMTEDGYQSLTKNIANITLELQVPIEITSLEDSAPVIMNDYRSFELSFESNTSIYYEAFRIFNKGKNNWRKMHGLPLLRKFRRRR